MRKVSGERGAALAMGATVFCMVLGSSSVPELLSPGRKLRWASLAVLLVVAIWLALREMRHPQLRTVVVIALGTWLAGLGLVSTAWSVDPRLTFGRAGSFTLLLLAAAALALAVQSRPRLSVWLLYGMLGGVSAAALGGLAALALQHQDAVQAATAGNPSRYRGLGENPDTVALLIGLTAPVALWALLRARSKWERIASALVLALLVGSLVASQSRGGLAAAGIGSVVLLLLILPRWWRRLVFVGAVALAVLGVVVIRHAPSSTHTTSNGRQASISVKDARYAGRLEDELNFRHSPSIWSVLGSSGRTEAWRGALNQIKGRPLLGYGFGTENHVFVDRFYDFEGSYVENSFLGVGLQLGIIGAVSIIALIVAVAAASVPRLRRPRALGDPAPALAAVGVAGLVLMFVQSYVYSVGDVATVTFWVSCFVLSALPAGPQSIEHQATGQKSELEPAPGPRVPVATA
jgi:O-antigen ligase